METTGFSSAGKHWQRLETLPTDLWFPLFQLYGSQPLPSSCRIHLSCSTEHPKRGKTCFLLLNSQKRKKKRSSILAAVFSKMQFEADTQPGNFNLNSWRLAKPHLQLKTVESVWQTKLQTIILLYRIPLRAKKPFFFSPLHRPCH